MARFDVYRFNHGAPLVVEVQADLLSDLASVVVVPLLPYTGIEGPAMLNLTPIINVLNASHRLITTDISAISRLMLGPKVANIQDQRAVIVDAIDFLLQGF